MLNFPPWLQRVAFRVLSGMFSFYRKSTFLLEVLTLLPAQIKTLAE